MCDIRKFGARGTQMFHRREFLKTSTLVGVGTAATACAGRNEGLLIVPESALSVSDMDAYIARLDGSMNALATGPSPIPKLFPDKNWNPKDPVIKSGEELLRKNLRSLLLVGSFQDLPEEGRAYPAMQDRMWSSMAEMDEAMRGTHNSLSAMTPTERADIGRALKADPGLGMRIVEAFDIEAAAQGLPMQRRMHMRTLALQVTNRLKQSSPMFIDEYTTKTQKILTRSTDTEDIQRQILAALGEEEFFALRERTFKYSERWRLAQANAPAGAAPVPYGHGQAQAKSREPRGTGAITAGAIMLGLGVVILLISLAVGDIGGAFGVTAGAVLGLAGLITLIVGAAIRASST